MNRFNRLQILLATVTVGTIIGVLLAVSTWNTIGLGVLLNSPDSTVPEADQGEFPVADQGKNSGLIHFLLVVFFGFPPDSNVPVAVQEEKPKLKPEQRPNQWLDLLSPFKPNEWAHFHCLRNPLFRGILLFLQAAEDLGNAWDFKENVVAAHRRALVAKKKCDTELAELAPFLPLIPGELYPLGWSEEIDGTEIPQEPMVASSATHHPRLRGR